MNKLLGLLEEETKLYGLLLLTLQQEKKAVVGSKLEKLNEAGKEKENLLLKIRILEEQRVKIMEALAAELGCSSKELTLIALSQSVGKPYSDQFKKCRSNLLSLTQSIKEINRANAAMFNYSVELVKSSLDLLDNIIVSNPVYYRTGKIQTGHFEGRVFSGEI